MEWKLKGEKEQEEEDTVSGLLIRQDFKGDMGKLMAIVLPLQRTVAAFINQNKLLESRANWLKSL